MRRLMARDLLLHSARSLSLRSLAVLRTYRREREALGEQGMPGFDLEARERAAAAAGCPAEAVAEIVSEWIDRRPLKYLAALRYDGLAELFAALGRSGRTIGVLSDFPAAGKMAALELPADIIVSATDPGIGVSKPSPAGLRAVMARADATSEETLMIGDRWDRDGLAAQACGAHCLIRSDRPQPGRPCFSGFADDIFSPVLAGPPLRRTVPA